MTLQPFEARFTDRCRTCNAPINIGDIAMREPVRGGRVVCLDCGLDEIGAPKWKGAPAR